MQSSRFRTVVLGLAILVGIINIIGATRDLGDTTENALAYYQILIESVYSALGFALIVAVLLLKQEGRRLEQLTVIAVGVSFLLNLGLSLGWALGRLTPEAPFFIPLIPAVVQVVYFVYYLKSEPNEQT